MSLVIYIHLLKTHTNRWLYQQYYTFHVTYIWPANSITTEQETLWTKRLNPVHQDYFAVTK